MFGHFNPNKAHRPPSTDDHRDAKKKKKHKKRRAEQAVEELERETLPNPPTTKRLEKGEFASKDEETKEPRKRQKSVELDENPADVDMAVLEDSDDVEDIDDAQLAEEGRALLLAIDKKQSDAPTDVYKLGYNVDDYDVKTFEFDNCTHEYVAPRGYQRPADFRRPKVKPKQYKFTLDKFQDRAVECIERDESVLVAAHTSAGKTAIAEYAIAQSLQRKQRVIYTSPIKALSNQKYRELQEEFHDVGLMTGDVTINETASCLVMTTEILRSMLYNGSEVTREMAWVIFDEVHYMRDKERGVVWEETIILLPTAVKYVFLSATIPNAREFCEWIVKIKQQPCNVVYTDFRPTPLQHYLFPTGAQGIYLVVDEKGLFRENNFAKAI